MRLTQKILFRKQFSEEKDYKFQNLSEDGLNIEPDRFLRVGIKFLK